jgi:hypothetical protein
MSRYNIELIIMKINYKFVQTFGAVQKLGIFLY